MTGKKVLTLNLFHKRFISRRFVQMLILPYKYYIYTYTYFNIWNQKKKNRCVQPYKQNLCEGNIKFAPVIFFFGRITE